MDKLTRDKLVTAIARYDRRVSARERTPNIYRLGIILGGLDRVEERMKAGADLREALCASFHGRLLEQLIKAVGLPRATDSEVRGDKNPFPF